MEVKFLFSHYWYSHSEVQKTNNTQSYSNCICKNANTFTVVEGKLQKLVVLTGSCKLVCYAPKILLFFWLKRFNKTDGS